MWRLALSLLGVIKQRTRDGTESFSFLKVRFIVSYIYIFNKSTLAALTFVAHDCVLCGAGPGAVAKPTLYRTEPISESVVREMIIQCFDSGLGVCLCALENYTWNLNADGCFGAADTVRPMASDTSSSVRY